MPDISNYRCIPLNGKDVWLPRVTRILSVINKPGLNNWRADLGREASDQYTQETRDIGSEIHKLVAGLILQEAISKLQWELLSEEIKNGVRAYIRFQRQTDFHPIDAEVLVYSLTHHYVGTLDAPGTFGTSTDLEIVDWKSNDSVWDEYVIQLAAYFVAWNEMHPEYPAVRARIVNLDRNTGVPQSTKFEKEELLYTFEHAFLPAKEIFHYLEINTEKGRHIETLPNSQNKQETAAPIASPV